MKHIFHRKKFFCFSSSFSSRILVSGFTRVGETTFAFHANFTNSLHTFITHNTYIVVWKMAPTKKGTFLFRYTDIYTDSESAWTCARKTSRRPFFCLLRKRVVRLGLVRRSRKLRALRNRFRRWKTSRDRSMRPTTDGYPLTLIHSTDEKVSKAAKAAKYVKKGAKGKLLKKRFSPTFHRPRTLKNARAPKYPRVSVPPPQKLDQFQVRNSCFTRW